MLRWINSISLVVLAGCSSNVTYDYACPRPLKHWTLKSAGVDHHGIILRIEIDGAGSLQWFNRSTNEAEIRRVLEIARTVNPQPFIILAPATNAPCDRVREVRAMIDTSYCGNGWRCGEGRGNWQPIMFGPPERWKLFNTEESQ